MSLPANFTGTPQEQLPHHFRNTCLEFKKTLKSTKDTAKLESELDRFINVCRGMNWNHQNTETYHKNENEKAVNKLVKQFKRYLADLQSDEDNATPQAVIETISDIENLKVF